MEVGPPMGIEQANPSNNLMLLLLRAMVVSDKGKGCIKQSCKIYEDERE